MAKVGGQLGSNPGGRYRDAHGKDHYVKFAKSPARAQNEVLAGHLYQAAGAPVIQARLMDAGKGQMATATPWQHGVEPIDRHDPVDRADAQKHFASHAWLANWDAAGLEYDNQGRVKGEMTTLDPGGSLLFRAQGQPKGDAFGDDVPEWDTMRSQKHNRQAHRVFGEMTPEQLRASAARVAAVPDAKIRGLVALHGPGSAEQKKALADRLVKRKQDVTRRGLQVS